MKTELNSQIIHELCLDFVDYLEDSILENYEDFPFTIACSHFLNELQEYGLDFGLNSFDQNIIKRVYQEFENYLKKKE